MHSESPFLVVLVRVLVIVIELDLLDWICKLFKGARNPQTP